jgi:nucleoid-associated protein YgaU
MASLTAHLRRPDDHDRLGFHPECPICRSERLSGAPPLDAIVGRRNQALLAASVLALSTATPSAALAAGPDHETEGTTAPELVANDPVQPAPAFDPGGQSTELTVDVAPPPEAIAVPDASGDTAPLEQEPAMDEVAPVADAGDTPAVEQQEPAPAAEPVPPPPAAEPVAPTPPPTPPAQQAPAVTHQEPQVETSPPPRATERPTRVTQPKKAPAPAPAVAPAQPPVQPVAAPAVASAPVPVAQATHRAAAQPADRFHVVQRGESLWSIAKDVLGDDASVARIAREVNRLWELNSERIGTGEPDLVIPGTRIVLR